LAATASETPPQGSQGRGAGLSGGITPPQGWREKLSTILTRPEFRKREARESLLARAWKWVLDTLGSLLPQGTSRAIAKVAGWVVYTLAGLAFVTLVGVLIRATLPLFRRGGAGETGKPTVPPTAPETPESLLALAEQRNRAGDLRGAVQAIFRWLLLSLQRAGRLEYDPALTNREHLARLQADAASRTAFAEVSAEFEVVWYALRPVNREAFGAFRSRCFDLAGGRP
jgi:hypothetical protein